MAAAKDVRHSLLAMVHIAQKELRLDDGVYRAILSRGFGAASAAELTVPQLESLVRAFEAKGWARKSKKPRCIASPRSGRASSNQLGMIRGLWVDITQAGRARDPTEKGLRRFAKRVTGVDALDWLTREDAAKVIEGLKSWRDRQPAAPSR